MFLGCRFGVLKPEPRTPHPQPLSPERGEGSNVKKGAREQRQKGAREQRQKGARGAASKRGEGSSVKKGRGEQPAEAGTPAINNLAPSS